VRRPPRRTGGGGDLVNSTTVWAAPEGTGRAGAAAGEAGHRGRVVGGGGRAGRGGRAWGAGSRAPRRGRTVAEHGAGLRPLVGVVVRVARAAQSGLGCRGGRGRLGVRPLAAGTG